MNLKQNKTPIFALLSLVIIAIFTMIPSATLSRSALYVLGVFVSAIFLWITVGVSWPSLLVIAELCFLPNVTANSILSSSFGNSSVAFLIFTFCCSYALEQTQFVKRCAVAFLSIKAAQKNPWAFVLIYFASILVLGSFMSTTVIVIIYLTLNEEIFEVLGIQKGHTIGHMMTMGLIIVSAISGAITPIAHVFPVMAMSIYEKGTGLTISYIKYMACAIPVGILMMFITTFIFKIMLKPDIEPLRSVDISRIKATLLPADKKEKLTVTIFMLVVALWIFPDLLVDVFPKVMSYIKAFGTPLPPLIGTILLCVIPVEGKPVMDLAKTLSNISWIPVFMSASALCLGGQIASEEIGLSSALTAMLAPMLQDVGATVLVFALVAFTGYMTNIASNMVTVTLACTMALPIALSMASVNTAALLSVIGMASAYAFATPAAMTTVVLGTSSGWTDAGTMAKFGFIILTIALILIVVIAYPIAAVIM